VAGKGGTRKEGREGKEVYGKKNCTSLGLSKFWICTGT